MLKCDHCGKNMIRCGTVSKTAIIKRAVWIYCSGTHCTNKYHGKYLYIPKYISNPQIERYLSVVVQNL